MQSQTFHGRDAANAELVLYDGDAIWVCPHICFERERDAVLARLHTVIGKTIDLPIVLYRLFHSIISVVVRMKIKRIVSFFRKVENITDLFCERSFRRFPSVGLLLDSQMSDRRRSSCPLRRFPSSRARFFRRDRPNSILPSPQASIRAARLRARRRCSPLPI